MASNTTTVRDLQGQFDDWIELYNAGPTPIDVSQMYLTDDVSEPRRWQIPDDGASVTTIPPQGYLLIWADNDLNDAGLHTSFGLGADGDEVALYDTDGSTLIDWIRFDRQRPDVSWGREPDASPDWVTLAPTPGASNDGAFLAVVADTTFSHDRGFYETPFAVTITTETPDATIVYTLDGSTPTPGHSTVYDGPIVISRTTCLRAMAFKSGYKSTNVDTHTYLFLDNVIGQATNPATGNQVTPPGYPTSWGNVTGDYQMDPDVVGQDDTDVFGGRYASTIKNDLKAVATISLVMNPDDWFGSKGIYINQSQDGTERVASIEYIDPNDADGFQVNCAIATQGGVSGGGTSLDRWKSFKLSMRPRFKTQTDDGVLTGGPSKLDFKLFADSPVERFNTVVLDAVLNHSWLHPTSSQRNSATYIQDQYVADLHNAIGGHSPHGSYAHVYINGLYWGLYYVHERPDHAWAAQIFGGDEDEYDAIKHNASGVINNGAGSDATASYNAMVSAASAVASNPTSAARYEVLCEQLDVDDFIAYLLANWFCGNHDWPHKNWYATCRTGGKWHFHSWDAEHTLEGTDSIGDSPSDIHNKLVQNAEYRLRFADLAYRAFFNAGPLSYPKTAERFRARMDEIEAAIVGESARWGDNRQPAPYTQQNWLDTQNNRLADFFPGRSDRVLNGLRNAGLYPDIDAPDFVVNGLALHGGRIACTDAISMTADGGTIWYTLDGSDPHEPSTGSGFSDELVIVAENAAKRVLVPTGPVDNAWRSGSDFDDSAWISGTGGVGYERSTGYEPYFDIDLINDMFGRNTSCYIRIPFNFTVEEAIAASAPKLKVRYDDGFIAYLNGIEIVRVSFDGSASWNSSATTTHSDIDAINLEVFDIRSGMGALRIGPNILAIQGLNASASSSDFLISVELFAVDGTAESFPSNVCPTANRYVGPATLDGSATIKARVLDDSTWSALHEATFAVGPIAESLRITEIMYHPIDTGQPTDPNTEYIELTNIGAEVINLNLVRFTDGVDFTFPSLDLAPAEHLLVVKDVSAFEARYGGGFNIAGQYTGSLSNGGERLVLSDAVGQVIADFRFQDDWYDLTDGLGFSLTVKDPAKVDPTTLSERNTWRASTDAGGSPGSDDTGY